MVSIPKLWELRVAPRGPAQREWGMRELRQAMGQSQEVSGLTSDRYKNTLEGTRAGGSGSPCRPNASQK